MSKIRGIFICSFELFLWLPWELWLGRKLECILWYLLCSVFCVACIAFFIEGGTLQTVAWGWFLRWVKRMQSHISSAFDVLHQFSVLVSIMYLNRNRKTHRTWTKTGILLLKRWHNIDTSEAYFRVLTKCAVHHTFNFQTSCINPSSYHLYL